MVSKSKISEFSSVFRPNAPDDKSFQAVFRANNYYSKKDYESAIEEYSKALSILQSSPETKKTSDFAALVFSNRSASFFQRKKWKHAVKDAEQVIRIRPEWPKAEALVQLEKYEEALDCYHVAQQKDPRNTQIQHRIEKALILRDNKSMGQDICIAKNSITNKIRCKIFEFAVKMKNLIYVIVDNSTKECIVIDACWDVDGIIKFIKNKRLKLVGAIVTHHHFDHVGGKPPPPFNQLPIKVSGLCDLLKRFPKINAYIHPSDIPHVLKTNPELSDLFTSIPLSNLPIRNRQSHLCNTNILSFIINSTLNSSTLSNSNASRIIPTPHNFILSLGNFTLLRFLHTPGHTEGSQSILVNETRLFTGDTLMCGCTGRLDLPGGNLKQMKKTLRKRLGDLDDKIVVFPGHDYGGDWTTIGIEKRKGIIGKSKRK
ncbi:5846_t:CDS:2 [Racocetra persica]|uniref:5846_t:CDS:1 n=1 Tax=Racocetra persica TaxID=160502 RepID=A0ACA9MP40_9GLOM|nr:5846_t:CDS:2 [Racocetra persica]